jgi:CheY-like chemotaxis protein
MYLTVTADLGPRTSTDVCRFLIHVLLTRAGPVSGQHKLIGLMGSTVRVESPWSEVAGETGTAFFFDLVVSTAAAEAPTAPAAIAPAAPAPGATGKPCRAPQRAAPGDGGGRVAPVAAAPVAPGGLQHHLQPASVAVELTEAATAASSVPGPQPPPLRVLLADDTPANRKLLHRAFTRFFGPGWEVSEAATAEEALRLGLETRFAVVSADEAPLCRTPMLTLPLPLAPIYRTQVIMDEIFSHEPTQMRGSQAIQQLREHEGRTRIIPPAVIISCTGNTAHTDGGLADHVWCKPMPSFTDGTMQREVTELLDAVGVAHAIPRADAAPYATDKVV